MVRSNVRWQKAMGWRRGVWICFAIVLLSLLSLAPYLTSSTEAVRMRNALLLIEGNETPLDWAPPKSPDGFMLEGGPPDPIFAEAVNRLGLAGMASDWDRAIAISRHLLAGNPSVGGAIRADLRTTYVRILTQGDGYCGDFTRVFSALATAAGIPVRSWAFSFDGFGGHGHVWPEIWNRQLNRWQLIDIFDNSYFTLSDGVAISALEFRRAMKEHPRELRLVPLYSGARPGYVIEEKAWDYYRRGLPEWYQYWGNNIFSYERAFMVRSFVDLSRSLAQFGGIVQGVSPGIRILKDPANQVQEAALIRLRQHLLIVGGLCAVAFVALGFCLAGWWLSRRRYLRSQA